MITTRMRVLLGGGIAFAVAAVVITVVVVLSQSSVPASGADPKGAGVATASLPADAVAKTFPAWALGPFTRYSGNPILKATGAGFESDEVYNPGVVYRDGKFQMLYRGQHGKVSEIGYAYSTDGHTFTRYAKNPVISNTLPSETAGVEDPRLYELNGTYYAFFTGFNGHVIDLNEAPRMT